MKALGDIFDIGLGWAPVDLDTADGATGKRCSLQGAGAITFVVTCGVGGADDLVLDVNQHTAYTSGTSADLDVVTVSHIKAEALLDNDETWVAISQTAASEVTIVGATYGVMQKLIVISVNADQLSDGYTHVSLNAASTTSTAQLSSCIYLLHELGAKRNPILLPNLLRPGAANA